MTSADWLQLTPTEETDAGISNAMPLIRSIDKSVRELRDDLYDFKKETRKDIAGLKQDVAILKNDVDTLKDDVKALKVDMIEVKGDIRSLAARMDGTDKRLDDIRQAQSKWFLLLGILVAAVPIAIALIQSFMMK